jgi:hypothetical protein
MLLVAIWLPASSHALLEVVGLIHERHADHEASATGSHEHDSGDHDAADGLCLRPATGLNSPVAYFGWVPLWVGLHAHIKTQASCVASPAAALMAPGTAPPEVCCGWRFIVRAAPQVRAPSRFINS